MANPMLEEAICPLCGMGWCGRPCLRDPKKSNALLFHPDRRQKTLKERGLGWDDPPPKMLVVPMRKLKLLPAPKAVSSGGESNKESNKANKESNRPKAESNAPKKFDRAAYQRETMRKRRAAAKALKEAEAKKPKPRKTRKIDFKG